MTEKKVPQNKRRLKSNFWKWHPSRRDRVGFRGLLIFLIAIQAYLQWGHPLWFPSKPSFDQQAARAFFTADSIRQAVAQQDGSQLASRASREALASSDPSDSKGWEFQRNRIDTSVLNASDSANITENERPKIELNSADSMELVGVRGIGAYSAHVILEARRAFGGFFNLDQLGELYGIYPENLELIRAQVWVDSTRVQPISINTATYEELVAHPYIPSDLAAQIVRFRELFRPFQNVRELGQLDLRNPLDFDKLAPYLITHSTADTIPSDR